MMERHCHAAIPDSARLDDRRRPLALVGCGGTGIENTLNASPQVVEAQKGQDKKPAELTTPDRRIDVDKADSVVQGEVKGGESKNPTPIPFLFTDKVDAKAIHDEPYEIAVPVGLDPVAASIPASNPMTKGKVELGKQLYFDPGSRSTAR